MRIRACPAAHLKDDTTKKLLSLRERCSVRSFCLYHHGFYDKVSAIKIYQSRISSRAGTSSQVYGARQHKLQKERL